MAVIEDENLSRYTSNDFVPNEKLITFVEAKHMSAFAELVAGFVGMVHELQPERLQLCFRETHPDGPKAFLYVSGHFNPTAAGIVETVEARLYDIDARNCDTGKDLCGLALPLRL